MWLLGLKVTTPASQAGDVGFKSRRSYCGHRTVAVKRTQFALQICGSAPTDSPWSHYGWVCLAARAADCKSVTQKHRRFESCPIHFRLRVRVVYGAILLRWCAATHRRFKSFRKRSKTGIKYPDLSVYILRHHVCTESFEDSLTQRVFCVRHIFHSTYFVRINPNGGFIA